MQVEAKDTAPPHFFFIGARATPGTAVSPGAPGEQVAVIVLKHTVRTDGTRLDTAEVLQEDEPYRDVAGNPVDFSEHIRIEADLAPTKAELDVVIVRNRLDLGVLTDWDVRLGGALVQANTPYGWTDRGVSPRVDLAYDPTIWDSVTQTFDFDPETELLPKGYDNAYMNGGHVTGRPVLGSGAVVAFDNTTTGASAQVTVPAAPALRVLRDGVPVDAQPDFGLAVDTVVYDELAGEFLLTWRGVLVWDGSLSDAVLEVA